MMNLDPGMHTSISVSGVERPGNAGPAAPRPGSPGVRKAGDFDTVTLSTCHSRDGCSDFARVLARQAAGQIAARPEPDSQQLAQLKQAVADGSYRPDPDRIAGRLLGID